MAKKSHQPQPPPGDSQHEGSAGVTPHSKQGPPNDSTDETPQGGVPQGTQGTQGTPSSAITPIPHSTLGLLGRHTLMWQTPKPSGSGSNASTQDLNAHQSLQSPKLGDTPGGEEAKPSDTGDDSR
jgi:hypothetical protein